LIFVSGVYPINLVDNLQPCKVVEIDLHFIGYNIKDQGYVKD